MNEERITNVLDNNTNNRNRTLSFGGILFF